MDSSDPDFIRTLRDDLGPKLLADIVVVGRYEELDQWTNGTSSPTSAQLARLRVTARVVGILRTTLGGVREIRHWLKSPHPALREKSPADALTDGQYEAVIAASTADATSFRSRSPGGT